jgi:long-chain fatty acid transport protein
MPSAKASSFGLSEGATDWMANGYAGETAKAYDASTVFANPAGMTTLTNSEMDAALNGIFPQIHFSGTDKIGGMPVSGTSSGNFIQAAATAAQFGVMNVSPDFKVGLAVTTPFAQRTAYPADFVGRYQALTSSITDIELSLAGAYRVGPKLSIGLGPDINYLSARLTSALNLGLGPLGDGDADVHGQHFSAGYTVGALYQFSDTLRAGISYHSRFWNTIQIGESIVPPAALQAANPQAAASIAALSSHGSTKLTLPDYLAIGIYNQITPKLALMADFRWTDWSLIQSINVVTNNGLPPSTFPEHWHNTGTVAAGASYRVMQPLLLQGGLWWEGSPVNDANRTARVPDSDRVGIGIGITYALTARIDLQAAYSHMFFASQHINQSVMPAAGILSGSFDVSDNSASLGIRFRF